MSDKLEVRDFLIRSANWASDKNNLSNLRRVVFIVEQQVSHEEEWDGQDESAYHWLATDHTDHAIGTSRLLPTGQIGRMAVLAEYRGTGVGAALLEAAVNEARRLGMPDIYLNAQSHALGFYERAGFIKQGEEFMEAGIPHFRMRQPTPTNESKDAGHAASRRVTPDLAAGISLRLFDTTEAGWQADGKILKKLRQQVLVRELGLPAEFVTDDTDEASLHWHAQSLEGETIGVVRMDLEGHIGRLVVLPEYSDRGVGQALLEAAIAKATRFGLSRVWADAPTSLTPFYSGAGFAPEAAPFTAHGLEHQLFARALNIDDIAQHRRLQGKISGDTYVSEDHHYTLGEDKQLLLLRHEAEFKQVILDMCQQASKSIRIWSPMLDHKLFHHDELRESFSRLARRNRYTSIEILLYDSHRVVTNTHALLEISRKLPTSIKMKLVHPELRKLNHEFVLADGEGVIFRQDYENYEGYAKFRDITENQRLGRQFKSAWESGLYDPNLRQLKI
jgi:predicted GNAT family N-acyltransferase